MALDPAMMDVRPTGPIQLCPACGAEVPVRYSDQFRTAAPVDPYSQLRPPDRPSGLFRGR
jgi:hypothetical protein